VSFYLDTSAFLKLFMAETASEALRTWWVARPGDTCSSDLLRTEALRATRRISPDAVAAARHFLEAIPLIRLDSLSYDRAGLVEPPQLRSLDALHLIAASSLGDDLDGLVTYDDRLADGARRQGMKVLAPS
jgi:predicted nucleic acid-binding protein